MAMAGPAMIVIVRLFVAVRAILSVTLKTISVGPVAAVGVPVIAPVAGIRDKPAGNVPDCIDHV